MSFFLLITISVFSVVLSVWSLGLNDNMKAIVRSFVKSKIDSFRKK